MPYVHVDVWPAGIALGVAAALIAVMRAAERYAHKAAVERTRRALRHAVSQETHG